ncbi:MAG: hypothetical protein LLG04_08025 [Parachlamydia sp.]|nr:hypothetical protein [Parachlamydia sp.]
MEPANTEDPSLRPLTQLLRWKEPAKLQIAPELLSLFKTMFETMRASVSSMDHQFPEWRLVSVNNLIASLLREEREREEGDDGYREHLSKSLFQQPLTTPIEERRLAVAWSQQRIADIEAGRATTVTLIKPPYHCLEIDKIQFNSMRHLQYLTEREPEMRRQQCQDELKAMDNPTLRKRFLESCRGPSLKQSRRQLAAIPASDMTWEQLAFEWLEKNWDEPPEDDWEALKKSFPMKRPEQLEVDVRYCMERRALLIETLLRRYLDDSKDKQSSGDFSAHRKAIKSTKKEFKSKIRTLLATQPSETLRLFLLDWQDLLATTLTLKEKLEELKKPPQNDGKGMGPGTPPMSPKVSLVSPRHESPRAFARLTVASPRTEHAQNRLSPKLSSMGEAAGQPLKPGSTPVLIASPRPRGGTGTSAVSRLSRVDSSKNVAGSTLKSAAGGSIPHLARVDSKGSLGSSPASARGDSLYRLKMPQKQSSPRQLNRALGDLIALLQTEIKLLQKVEKALSELLEKSAVKPLPLLAPFAAKGPAPLLFFDPGHPAALPYSGYLQELIDGLEQLATLYLDQFDRKRPIAFLQLYYEKLQKEEAEDNHAIFQTLQEHEANFKRDNFESFCRDREAYEDALAFERMKFQMLYRVKKHPEGLVTLPLLKDLKTPEQGREIAEYVNKIYFGRPPQFKTSDEFLAFLNSKSLLDFMRLKVTQTSSEGPAAELTHKLIPFIQEQQKGVNLFSQTGEKELAFYKRYRSYTFKTTIDSVTQANSFDVLKALEAGFLGHLFEETQQFKAEAYKRGFAQIPGISRRPLENLEKLLQDLSKAVEKRAVPDLAGSLEEQDTRWQSILAAAPKAEKDAREQQNVTRLNLLERTAAITRYASRLLLAMKLTKKKMAMAKSQGNYVSRFEMKLTFEEMRDRLSMGKNLKKIVDLLPTVAQVVFTLPLPGKYEAPVRKENSGSFLARLRGGN